MKTGWTRYCDLVELESDHTPGTMDLWILLIFRTIHPHHSQTYAHEEFDEKSHNYPLSGFTKRNAGCSFRAL